MTNYEDFTCSPRTVSVIVPIYEVEDYIGECLQSICNQTYKNLEIICVNDATLDNSVLVVRSFMRDDPRIKLVNNPTNRGLGGARNAGLDVATGEYVYFVDSDDWIDSTAVETLVKLLEASGVEWVMCAPVIEENAPTYTRPFHSLDASTRALMGVWDYTEELGLIADVWPSAWLSLRRRQFIEECGARFPENMHYEDHAFHYRCAFASTKMAYVEKHLYHYRNARTGQITKDPSERVFEIIPVLKAIKSELDANVPKGQAKDAFERVAVRLLLERLAIIDLGSEIAKRLKRQGRGVIAECSDDRIVALRPSWASEEWTRRALGDSKGGAVREALRGLEATRQKTSSTMVKLVSTPLKRIFRYRYERVMGRISHDVASEVYHRIGWEFNEIKRQIEDVKSSRSQKKNKRSQS